MPRACTVCQHPQLPEIESAIIRGQAYRSIAKQWGLGESSVYRHEVNCMGEEISAAKQANKEARGLDVMEQLRAANSLVIGIIRRTSSAKINAQAEGLTPAEAREEQRLQDALLLQAADRWHKQVELAAKLQGELLQEGITAITVEIVQQAVEQGQERARAYQQQHGIVPGKPRLLDAG